jgi:nicotinamidase-related amidase
MATSRTKRQIDSLAAIDQASFQPTFLRAPVMSTTAPVDFGSDDLRLPEALRGPLKDHLAHLHQRYLARGWAGRVGFGQRPALIVIDLARYWLDTSQQIGANLDSVVKAACQVLEAARNAGIPIFFTTFAFDPADPPSPQNRKLVWSVTAEKADLFDLDPRLNRRPTEKIVRKRYASAFKGTNLHEMLSSLGVDTLIVTGVSTSHCVYATCRDATDSFRVIVPREAVGERCEIMHEVNLLDIDIDLGDVMPVAEVVARIAGGAK